MADFSHLKKLDVSVGQTTEYVFNQITVNDKSPVLIVAPATEANKPYFNALLRRAGKTTRQVRSGSINIGMLEDNRTEDRSLYPKHVVKGWRDVTDAGGDDVPFSVESCTDFLTALPDWLFDELRSFCGNPASFADVLDSEATAKN